ncbi:Sodium- and chloride-dependent GABA transporter 1 [Coemansia sp. BCRC 34490]|nr:Sodium- and chloride-dependent GABA transporter 1 [Coemansia sp. BCRC 34490]
MAPASSSLASSSKPSTPTTLLSSSGPGSSTGISPIPCTFMDAKTNTSAAAFGNYYGSPYHYCFEQPKSGYGSVAEINNAADTNSSSCISDTNCQIELADNSTSLVGMTDSALSASGVFDNMSLMTLHRQQQQHHQPQYQQGTTPHHDPSSSSVFPALTESPIQSCASPFGLLVNDGSMGSNGPQLSHSVSQPNLFAQTVSFPADLHASNKAGGTRVLRRRNQAGLTTGALRRASSPGNSSRSHPYIPQIPGTAATPSATQFDSNPSSILPHPADLLRRSNSITSLTPFISASHGLPSSSPSSSSRRPHRMASSTFIIPAINQDGTSKRCANCSTAETPSWRRHPDTQELLCNACGLYLRLHRKPRPITLDDSGNIQVVRKNAAVQREPINLRAAAGTSGCGIPFSASSRVLEAPAPSFAYQQPATLALQLTSPVHSIDGLHGVDITNPFGAMHIDAYPHPLAPAVLHPISEASGHHLNDAAAATDAAGFSIDDILQPRVLGSSVATSRQSNAGSSGDDGYGSDTYQHPTAAKDVTMKHSP